MGQLMVSASPGHRVSAARAKAVIAAASAACSSAESLAEHRGQVAATAGGDGAHGPPARGGQGQVGLAAVLRTHGALDQPGGLEPVDHPQRGGRGDVQGRASSVRLVELPAESTTSIRYWGSVTPLAPAIERAETATSAREDGQHGVDDRVQVASRAVVTGLAVTASVLRSRPVSGHGSPVSALGLHTRIDCICKCDVDESGLCRASPSCGRDGSGCSVLALLVGVGAGLGAVVFRYMIEGLTRAVHRLRRLRRPRARRQPARARGSAGGSSCSPRWSPASSTARWCTGSPARPAATACPR